VAETSKKTRWQYCNVLEAGADHRQLWIFNSSRAGFTLSREQSIPPNDILPPGLVAKDWKMLLQPKLNVALLPIEKVFLRVIHLPVGSFDETFSMVELQLEKLSPLPITQIVWSIEVLAQRAADLQTVIVVIVARDWVDEAVGQLEKQGYLPDRLEVPMIDQLQATPITGDGAWIYPAQATGKFTALVAWWYGGVLRSLGLLHVPPTQNRGELLEEQLKQMTWAGELEGWLVSEPPWRLVADDATARLWQPMFFSWLGYSVEVESPLAPSELAALTANRAARSQGRGGILPADYADRYRQQFINRLWGRGLTAVVGLYLLGVFIYFGLWGVQAYRTGGVQTQARLLNVQYTNALQLKARMQVLQDRQALKYAFLEGWKTTAELLPATLTLQDFEFKDGRVLSWNGIAPADQSKLVADFNDGLRNKVDTNGVRVFDNVEAPISKLNPGGGTVSWSFSGELANGEGQ
jgi:hypothetical protein